MILIKNGHLIDPANNINEKMDIALKHGKVHQVAPFIDPKNFSEVLEAEGLMVAPAFIDVHVHFREPGQEYKEDIESGSKATVAGGFTSVCTMPNTRPVIDTPSLVQYQIRRAQEVGLIDLYPAGAITKGQEGKELAEMGLMAQAGAVAFTDDGRPVMNAEVMRRALEYSKIFNKPIMDHCEDRDLSKGAPMTEGVTSTKLGLPGQPKASEYLQVARDIELAEMTGGWIHFCHLSTKEAVEMVREAKKRGIKVTAETCPHYFTLTDEAVTGYNTNAKMAPPLRFDEDVKAIRQGLADGTIDCISTDHAPHTPDEKNREMDQAPFGIIGLETAFSLTAELVQSKVLSWPDAVTRLAVFPAMILGIPKGKLSVGDPGDLVIFDPRAKWVYDVEQGFSKSKNSPFNGRKMTGKIRYTLHNGKMAYKAK